MPPEILRRQPHRAPRRQLPITNPERPTFSPIVPFRLGGQGGAIVTLPGVEELGNSEVRESWNGYLAQSGR